MEGFRKLLDLLNAFTVNNPFRQLEIPFPSLIERQTKSSDEMPLSVCDLLPEEAYDLDILVWTFLVTGYYSSSLKKVDERDATGRVIKRILRGFESTDGYVQRYYPFQLTEDLLFPEWCYPLNSLLFSQENQTVLVPLKKNIHDGMESYDLTRYSYRKSALRYYTLHKEKLENSIMADLILGFSLTNTIYSSLICFNSEPIITFELYSIIKPLIDQLCKLPLIRLRNRLAESAMSYIRLFQFSGESIRHCIGQLEALGSAIISNSRILLYQSLTNNHFNYNDLVLLLYEELAPERIWDYRDKPCFESYCKRRGIPLLHEPVDFASPEVLSRLIFSAKEGSNMERVLSDEQLFLYGLKEQSYKSSLLYRIIYHLLINKDPMNYKISRKCSSDISDLPIDLHKFYALLQKDIIDSCLQNNLFDLCKENGWLFINH